MPILSNVLIEADDGHISLTTTNLDLGIRCRIKAEVEESGGITLPVRKLATIVRELPQSEIFVETGKNNQVKNNLRWFTVSHHGNQHRGVSTLTHV